MNLTKTYIIALLFFLFSMLFMSSYIPHEYIAIPDHISYNENDTIPLMSLPDVPAENEPLENEPVEDEPGWWKHTGSSSVSYGSGLSQQNPHNSGTEEQETPECPEEIPEFPTMAFPVLIVMSLAFIFGRKK